MSKGAELASPSMPVDPAVSAAIELMIGAIGEELAEARRSPSAGIRVADGRVLYSSNHRFLYHFETDAPAPLIPADCPVTLRMEGSPPHKGTLVSVEEFRVLVEFHEDLGPSIRRGVLTAELWFVLEKLRDRLTTLANDEAPGVWRSAGLPLQLLGKTSPLPAGGPVECPSNQLNESQRLAIQACGSNSLHFVWGPPGTGKTITLAETARSLTLRGERILVLAHSNVAVDVAIARVADVMAGTSLLSEGKVLRYGTPVLQEVLCRNDVLPEKILRRQWPEMFSIWDQWQHRRKEIWNRLKSSPGHKERHSLASELEDLLQHIQRLEKQISEHAALLLAGAQIVGATLSRLVIDEALWALDYDAVIVDEVSMAAFPQVLSAASRARQRLLLFGDPRQLPPIYLAKTPLANSWLGRDAFAVAEVRNDSRDDRVSFLSTQYRMGASIARAVSTLAYQGRLVTPDVVAAKAREHARLTPLRDKEIAILDTSSLRSASLREVARRSYSRINPVHLAVATTLGHSFSAQGCQNLSVITPYRAQAHLSELALRDLVKASVAKVATVHRFQGSESDAVIIDLVDAPPQRNASNLTGTDEDVALRLLNVGLSRARGKLVVLVDVPFVTNRHPPGSPARRLLELAGQDSITRAEAVLEQAQGGIRWFSDWTAARQEIEADFAKATRSLVGHFPDGFMPDSGMVDAIKTSPARRKLLFAPVPIAAKLEATDADLALLPRHCGLVLIAAPEAAWIAGTDPYRPIARLQGAGLADALQEAVFGDAMRAPAPSAEMEAQIARACGRCSQCGEARRPQPVGQSWVLACSKAKHPQVMLGLPELTDLARAASAVCLECGGPVVSRMGPSGPFIGCERFGAGCEGNPPSLNELFG